MTEAHTRWMNRDPKDNYVVTVTRVISGQVHYRLYADPTYELVMSEDAFLKAFRPMGKIHIESSDNDEYGDFKWGD